MAIVHYLIWNPPLAIDSSSHWFMMQIGMGLGFLTSWPVNGQFWSSGRGHASVADFRDMQRCSDPVGSRRGQEAEVR
jgi:hypothetical protein